MCCGFPGRLVHKMFFGVLCSSDKRTWILKVHFLLAHHDILPFSFFAFFSPFFLTRAWVSLTAVSLLWTGTFKLYCGNAGTHWWHFKTVHRVGWGKSAEKGACVQRGEKACWWVCLSPKPPTQRSPCWPYLFTQNFVGGNSLLGKKYHNGYRWNIQN